MKLTERFNNQRVLVLGLAKSGYAAATLLKKLGADLTINDGAALENNQEANALIDAGFRVICGEHPISLLDERFDYVVKNPGIPYTNPIVQRAEALNIPIITEVELAYEVSEAPIVAITGSNGKTTTTTLLYHMLNIGKKKPLIAGNIGTVACTVAEKAAEDNIIVLEASSFQLMGIEKFKPQISIITNLYDAHLDYHGTFQAYAEAKANVMAKQDEHDVFIYNADQEAVVQLAEQSKAQTIPFSTTRKLEEGASADDEMIYWNGEPFIERSLVTLPGKHNLENILSAIASAILLNCDRDAMIDVLSSFTGVKHRMQFVRELEGRKYYNDSKATNTLATKSALSAFEQPVILIAGGLDRGHTFEPLRESMAHVKALVAVGETKERMVEFAKDCGVQNTEIANSMEEAVQIASALSIEKDVILLSPASASWDEYANFEIRGDRYIDAVMALE